MQRTREQFEQEAAARLREFAERILPDICIACDLSTNAMSEFVWRKQERRGHHDWRVTQTVTAPLCDMCLRDFMARRRWFWAMRYAAGIGFALAVCGVVAVPILLLTMNLSTSEREQVFATGVIAALLLPFSLLCHQIGRRLSVPRCFVDLARNGWECRRIRRCETVEHAGIDGTSTVESRITPPTI